MATVEQCETQSSGLPNISNTLYDDTFKRSQEEEKDSDEESFHLPMLDCDDDLDSNIKDTLISDISKDLHNGETEDEILNKFETNGTPDIDPKLEDSILDQIDNLLEKKLTDPINKNTDCDNELRDASVVKEEPQKEQNEKSPDAEILKVTENNTDSVSDSVLDEQESKTDEKLNDDKKNEESMENTDVVLEDESTDNKSTDAADKTVIEENIEKKETTEESETNGMDIDQQLDNEKISNEDKTTDETIDNSNETVPSEENTTVSSEAPIEREEEKNEFTEGTSKIDEASNDLNDIESKSNNDNTDIQTPSAEEAMETDNKEQEEVANKDSTEEVSDALNETPPKDDILCEDSNQCEISNVTDNLSEDKESSNEDKQIQEPVTTESEETSNTATLDSSQSGVGPDKCENSNESSQNLECEDLLDISIIRDADEDNASAIAENANDAPASEKSDNDNEDQDEGSDKAENELDESEMDQDAEDTLLANDKEDNMDFDDGSSNLLCDQDTIIDENISDSENKNNEVKDSDSSSKDDSVLKEKSDINNIELTSEKNGTEEISGGSSMESEENEDSLKENSTKSCGKRSLSDTDITESPNKKIKLTERSNTDEKITNHKNNKVKTLINFEKYMQNKKLENKLTRSDLEQFCLQKICEAIIHKTDVGELHQTIKKQEHIIENLRKDLQQLTKQTRDLDIVNKKLMNELRAQNGTKKPLVPLKITRSVGLQVKLNASSESNSRRKVPVPTTPRTPTNNTPTMGRPRAITPANSSVVRQVNSSPRKTPATAPLLSQALQNRNIPAVNNVAKRTPVRAKAPEPQKPANASVIDLTDEDDRASKGVVGNSVKILNKAIPLTQGKINIIPAKTVPNKMINSNQNKTVAVGQVKTNGKIGTPTRTVTTLPQGVRLTSTQVKNGSIAIPASVVTSSSGTQFMYVVQPGPVVTTTAGGTQKAVLLNFQPTNGVLSSAINGSAVSVLPSKTTNTVQLKTVAPRKHPAPLPSPPAITVNASLKPLLPKPHLSIRKTDTGIILQWRMPYNLDIYEAIASYQLFAYQETNAPPSTEMWRKVGDVKALALPMACTLTQFADKNKYYFAVRSIDVHKRIGAFSDPEEISL